MAKKYLQKERQPPAAKELFTIVTIFPKVKTRKKIKWFGNYF